MLNREPQFKAAKGPKKAPYQMRRVSKKRAPWNRQYTDALEARKVAQFERFGTTYCERCNAPGLVEGHHTQGRINESILIFKLICTPCHVWIHSNGRAARAEGLLS